MLAYIVAILASLTAIASLILFFRQRRELRRKEAELTRARGGVAQAHALYNELSASYIGLCEGYTKLMYAYSDSLKEKQDAQERTRRALELGEILLKTVAQIQPGGLPNALWVAYQNNPQLSNLN